MKTLISALGLSVSLALAPAVFAQENLEGELGGAMPKKEMPKMKIEEVHSIMKEFNVGPEKMVGVYSLLNGWVICYDTSGNGKSNLEFFYPVKDIYPNEDGANFYFDKDQKIKFMWRDTNGDYRWDAGELFEIEYPDLKGNKNNHPPVDLSDKKSV